MYCKGMRMLQGNKDATMTGALEKKTLNQMDILIDSRKS